MANSLGTTGITAREVEVCIKVLQTVAREPSIMDGNERFKGLVAKVHRQAKKAKRQPLRLQDSGADQQLAGQTAIVLQQLGAQALPPSTPEKPRAYSRPRRCYVCKDLFTKIHKFYHMLCPGCAALNWAKRGQRADIRGRTALITGGRVKIGFQTSLKLLRDGARVLVTTRFPQDAALRYQGERDCALWIDRLQIYGLDLRDVPGLEAFCRHVLDQEGHLDILIHNAAQTVKRPLAFYQHLLEAEASPFKSRALACTQPSSPLLEARPGYKGFLPGTDLFFPAGSLDLDGQQVDRRPMNSWRLKLGDVSTIELLEVLLVGTISPFVLNNRLLPALLRSPNPRRFIVSVSAMEGQFGWRRKTAFHPHTNMAKAALNMLTRTTAADLARKGVYINSVDTGWITDEKPLPQAERAREELGFHAPLHATDGASRIYDPIARGINERAEPLSGQFLKDYLPYPW
jgi:NAD(P)-dependent dehydrogenase (short-subunit alcohol dehydrogenase family)